MRVDTNTRGHHQWFYFSVKNHSNLGNVNFSVLNFTKKQSLYNHGMRVCVKSNSQDWHQDGQFISYKPSRLNQTDEGKQRYKQFYEMQFTYNFTEKDDTVYFAYCFPYTLSRLHNVIKCLHRKPKASSYLKEENLCYSLSGVGLPLLTITSNVSQCKEKGAPVEIDSSEFAPSESLPVQKFKKYIVVTARVHPGESNSSFIMEGFLEFITGDSAKAVDLRRKNIFKVVPMINPDCVIAGNYRTSVSGNDLNR